MCPGKGQGWVGCLAFLLLSWKVHVQRSHSYGRRVWGAPDVRSSGTPNGVSLQTVVLALDFEWPQLTPREQGQDVPAGLCSDCRFVSKIWMFQGSKFWGGFLYFFLSGCSGSSFLHAGFLLLQCAGFSLQWLLLQRTGSRYTDSMVMAPGLWGTGSVVVAHGLSCPRHVGSSQTRDRTCHVPCIGMQTHSLCLQGSPLGWFLISLGWLEQ